MTRVAREINRQAHDIISRVAFVEKLPFPNNETRCVAEWFVRRPKRCRTLVALETKLNQSAFAEHVEEVIKRGVVKRSRKAILFEGGGPVASLFDEAVKRVDAFAVGRAVYMACGVWESYWSNWIACDQEEGEVTEPMASPEELQAMEELANKLAN